MEKYNPSEIEKKWQEFWAKHPELTRAKEGSEAKKRFILDMFPYPSGAGLHVGHVESYTATDIYSRYFRLRGENVLHPQGFDAFGLPAENYAIKTGVHPQETTTKAVANFKRQMDSLGLSYDWSREVNSSLPEYYKWTQWFFLLLYKNGLAYKKKAKVNWCDSCKTVLANEQVENGLCERCKNPVRQKDLEQWFFRITDFVEDKENTSGLLSGLDKIDWPESTKTLQRNWVGRSEGAIVKFKVQEETSEKEEALEVFTTRVDTIFGCTYVVTAPEHSLIQKYKEQIENYAEVEAYLEETKKKSDLDRMEAKEKTGVELRGLKVVNPFNGEKVPVWVADYVLAQYGTGAVMAVPAHDERDFEFAKKFELPIKQSIAVYNFDENNPPRKDKKNTTRKVVHVILEDDNGNILTLNLKGEEWGNSKPRTFIIGGIEDGESIESATLREVREETGFSDIEIIKIFPIEFHAEFFAAHKDLNRYVKTTAVVCRLKSDKQENIREEEKKLHDLVWVKKKLLPMSVTIPDDIFFSKIYLEGKEILTDDGILIDSGEYSGLESAEAREKMAKWLSENDLGEKKVNYKLRDWLVSRQRYWGAPIPIIYCDKCGTVPAPVSQLPIELPTDVDFKPTGESPLNYSKTFQDVTCPECGAPARRESDTMDTFVCSSWYYFRYADPKNDKEFASRDAIKEWLPVDLYVGGAEHSVLHLLYSRFFTKVLHNLGYIDFDEPFSKLRHQGIILAEDGRKMSKSLGNVINPDDEIEKWGADSLRLFEMFMGPLEDMKPWQTKGIVGVYRFLEKVFAYFQTNNFGGGILNAENNDAEAYKIINKAIKKVGEDIEGMKFNTAISELMLTLNNVKSLALKNTVSEKAKKYFIEKYLIILSPFAPHLAEELWSRLGHEESIFKEKWPEYDESLTKDEEIELVLQVNGKIRDRVKAAADLNEEEAKKLALENEKVKLFISGKDIRKVIFVKGRLVNIVISS